VSNCSSSFSKLSTADWKHKEGKKERRKEGKKERRKEGKKERRKEGRKGKKEGRTDGR
jgi:hypothetical protein